ncbi:hypothetical protein D3C80_2136760 [compost metagenome]
MLINYGLDLAGVRYISKIKKSQSRCKDFIIISIIARGILFFVSSIALAASLFALTEFNIVFW